MKKMLALSFVLALFVTFTNADDKKPQKNTQEKKEKWCDVPAEGQHSVILDSKKTGLQPTKVDNKKAKTAVKESKSCESELEGECGGCSGGEAKTKTHTKKDSGKPKS